jgi:hypothetical protein
MTDETDSDLAYLRKCLEGVRLLTYWWDGEDRNIRAFTSKAELVEWYVQEPGVDGEPYRDRGFYTRELAHVSRIVKPRTIVEFGTSLGIGTCLLRWLNPLARLITVDSSIYCYMPGDIQVYTGRLSAAQDIDCTYITGNSWDYECKDVDLCFIDADHSYEAVVKDSVRSWENRSHNHKWAIVWHDYNQRHPGVMQAVAEFCEWAQLTLQSRIDSDTVWVMGDN